MNKSRKCSLNPKMKLGKEMKAQNFNVFLTLELSRKPLFAA